jgi:hypothetical protein
VIDRNAALEEMLPTQRFGEESPSERMLSGEGAISVDHAKSKNKHDISTLEIQGMEPEKLDREQLRWKRRSNSVKLTIGLLLLGFVSFVIIDATTNGYVKDGIEVFFEWIEVHPISGCFSFVAGTFGNTWFCMFMHCVRCRHGN